MFLLGFRRKLTALALCKSIESAIQWFQIHHRITFATILNPAVYLSGARISIFSTLVPRLIGFSFILLTRNLFRHPTLIEHGLYPVNSGALVLVRIRHWRDCANALADLSRIYNKSPI